MSEKKSESKIILGNRGDTKKSIFYGVKTLIPIIVKECKAIKEVPKYIIIYFNSSIPDMFGSASVNMRGILSIADGDRAIMQHDLVGRFNIAKRLFTQKFKLLQKQEQQNGDMLLKLIVEIKTQIYVNEEGKKFEFNSQYIETPEAEEIKRFGKQKHKLNNLQALKRPEKKDDISDKQIQEIKESKKKIIPKDKEPVKKQSKKESSDESESSDE